MITHAELLRLLSYDTTTGEFHWCAPRPKIRVGQRAGYRHHKGYRCLEIDGKHYSEHRLAWFYVTGRWPTKQIDHRDRVRDNNRFDNLREATNSQNRANSRTSNKHGLKGVRYHPWLKDKPWEAQIMKDRKNRSLGCYATKEEAHAAYCEAARELHGEFARF